MPFSRTNNGKVRLFPKAVGKHANTSCLDNSEKIISFCSELNSSDIPISERHGFIEHSASGAGSWNEMTCGPICRGLSGINQYVTYRTNQSPRLSSVRVLETNNECEQAYFSLLSPSPFLYFSASRPLP